MATKTKTSNTKAKTVPVKEPVAEQKKEEAPVVQKPLTTNKILKALRTFTDNGKTFFAGCCYPESFFSDAEKLKEKGNLC